MKAGYLIIAALILTYLPTKAQQFDGAWHGCLKIQGIELRIVFNIKQSTNSISATMDSPDQKAFNIPVATIEATDSTINIAIPKIGLSYNGQLTAEGSITGTFKQGMLTTNMPLSRQAVAAQQFNRPQNPNMPYLYKEELVKFKNHKDSITLAGTLTLPKQSNKAAAVVLISGSGAQNRDEEVAGHKPFLVLADHLTSNGVAVLRFDDRGSFDSEGDFSKATSFDFAEDVKSAINYLKKRPEIDSTKIGLIGHSEGGLIAPLVAVDDKTVAFIVMMAAPAVAGDSILLMQNSLIGQAAGMGSESIDAARKINREIYKKVVEGASKQEISTYITAIAPTIQDSELEAQLKTVLSPWFRTFLSYNPAPTLEKVICPVLALNGTKDLQVPYKENLDAMEKALKSGGNNNITVKHFEGMNHLFQMCETGSPNEYSKIEETINPFVLNAISDWIKENIQP